jgi:hypothetical protein
VRRNDGNKTVVSEHNGYSLYQVEKIRRVSQPNPESIEPHKETPMGVKKVSEIINLLERLHTLVLLTIALVLELYGFYTLLFTRH